MWRRAPPPLGFAAGSMHCRRVDREFLHFLLIFAGWPTPRQAIEATPLLYFLHFLHFLLPLPLDGAPWGRKERAGPPGEVCAVPAVCDVRTTDGLDAHFRGAFGVCAVPAVCAGVLSLGRPDKQVDLPAQRVRPVMVSDERCIEQSSPRGGCAANIT